MRTVTGRRSPTRQQRPVTESTVSLADSVLAAEREHDSQNAGRRRLLLRTLRQHAPVSRVELSQLTGISKPAMTRIASSLIEDGLVTESGQRPAGSQGGKPRTLLNLRGSALAAIGCVMQPGVVNAALSGFDGRVETRARIHFDRNEGPDRALAHMLEAIAEVAKDNPSERSIEGVGVGVPGMVDEQGRVFMASMPGWDGVPIGALIAEATGMKVRVDNAARLNTLGEMWFGGVSRVESVVVVDLSDGIAAGVVIRGRLWRGAHSLAGEIGHTRHGVDGQECRCGGIACWENLASTAELLAGLESRLPESATGTLTIDDVARRLDEPVVAEAVRMHADYLAAGLADVFLTYDPELVVLRGGSDALGDEFMATLNRLVSDRLRKFGGIRPVITASRLGANSDVLGAISLALRERWGLEPF